jgi:hypothetical protein
MRTLGWSPEVESLGPILEKIAMDFYAALDVSSESTAICIVNPKVQLFLEAVVASGPDILADRMASNRNRLARLGFEAGPLSEWLVRGLSRHGVDSILIETRNVWAAFQRVSQRPTAMTPRHGESAAYGMVPPRPGYELGCSRLSRGSA